MNLDCLKQVIVSKNEGFDEQKLIIYVTVQPAKNWLHMKHEILSNWAATASGGNIWAYCATYCSSMYHAWFPKGNERFVVLCGFVPLV